MTIDLHPLLRNRFYPHKVMDVRQWTAEQDYHRGARELLTRLGLGTGVLCGLDLDPTPDGTLVVRAGVAVDGHGRIVVVEHDVEIEDPARVTDHRGRPCGDPVTDGVLTLWLCHHECGVEVERLPGDCGGCGTCPSCCGEIDGRERCVASMTREVFSLHLSTDRPPRPGLPSRVCTALWRGHPELPAGARDRLDALLPRRCDEPDCCVYLGAVVLDGGSAAVTTHGRTVLRSNEQLLDLILCLAARVDACCGDGPAVRPPRVTAMWPPTGRPDRLAWERFVEDPRVELAFDRDMAEPGLDDPTAWFGVWQIDNDGIRRCPLRRAGGPLSFVTAPPGGDAVAYRIGIDAQRMTPSSSFVFLARTAAGGAAVAAGTDRLALDADLLGTGLSPARRDRLWQMAPDGTWDQGVPNLDREIPIAAYPPLPSGDGQQGGELHVALLREPPVAPPPRLLSVWPPGSALLDRARSQDWARFLEQPRIEIVVSRALDAATVQRPDEWLRLSLINRDGPAAYTTTRLPLRFTGDAPAGSNGEVAYGYACGSLDDRERWELLAQLRTVPGEPSHPAGEDEPRDTLDGDIRGTALDSQTLYSIWADDPLPAPFDDVGAVSTEGRTLYDGTAGGLAHWWFAVERP